MSRLTDHLTLWGPCVWLATCGGLVDFCTGIWGPGLILGGLIGFAAGRQRRRAERRDQELRARASDGLNGLYEPEAFEGWEIEDWELDEDEPVKGSRRRD